MTEPEFRAAFHQHQDAVYRFAWRMTNSAVAAEDIAQDVFLTLLRRPDCFDRTRGQLRSFLLGVARNLALKKWRDEGHWDVLDDESSFVHPVDAASGEIARMLGDAVKALPPLQREVLILAQYEGNSLDEIARAVNSEIGTVKARLHRARENLRHMLAPLKESTGRTSASHGTPK
jgi:RNA polymerase sigma factor (sigma-70 family)